MRKTKPRRITKGPDVDKCYDRMVEIMALLTGTQVADARIEYSAFVRGGHDDGRLARDRSDAGELHQDPAIDG